jgi:hypothetical protein
MSPVARDRLYQFVVERLLWPILLKVRQAKPGGVGSHVKENATENL